VLPPQHRLRKSGDFARVRKEGRSLPHPLLVLVVAKNGMGVTRIGFSVGKRVGKAHVRNLARRLLRESVRKHLPRIPAGHDLVINGRPALAGQPYAIVEAAVSRQLQQARLLLPVGDVQ